MTSPGWSQDPPRTNGPITFIVRLSVDEAGQVTGVVERARTRRKELVRSVEDVSRVIALMLAQRRSNEDV